MLDLVSKHSYDVNDLKRIVAILRAPGGCQWDGEQTHETLRRNILEESYEVVEAIDENSLEHLREELGDVLLQVVFHASIEEDAGNFDLDAVADGVCRKLIYRHPHVFGNVSVGSTEEILTNWEELKKAEKGQATQADALDAVARSLPALWRAEKVQKKAAKVGFEWPGLSEALDKLTEESSEVRSAIDGCGDVAEEVGDLLLAAVNVARFLNVDPELALHAACDKFCARFRRLEDTVLSGGRKLEDMTLGELSSLWDRLKHQ